MDLKDTRQEFTSAIVGWTDGNRLHSAQQRLRELTDAIEHAERNAKTDEDREQQIARARHALAVAGLEVLQHTIPALAELGKRALEAAGSEAVRAACAPRTQEHGAGDIRHYASRYRLPAEYASATSKIASAARAIAGLVIG